MSDTQDNNKSKPSFDPTTAKPVDTPLVAKSEGFNFDPSSAKETKKSKTDLIKDTGASLAAGIARIPDTLIGIGDIYTEGRLGRDIDKSDVYKTGEGQKYWEDKKSDISKEQEKTRQNIDGIWNKTKYVLENPSQITNAVVGSLPDMALGMGIGRASKIANPIVAASVGEGAVMAGAQAEGIRQQSDDQLLNNGQEAAAFGTGVIGGSLGAFGGWVANKVFKVADVDTALQTGRLTREQIGEATSQVKAKDIPLSIIKGAFSEGFLEELPQSVSEQIIQNLALDKPWNDSIEDAAVMGTLAGMAMGGTVSGVGKTMDWMNNPRSNISPQQDQIEPNNTESVGSVTPELGYNGLQGEYIPRADQVDPQQAQARYTYDQQSTDAENRLNFDNRNDLSGAMDNNDNPTGPDTPPTPNGNYFDRPNTYASIDQPPSQQMGIDPNNGPLSTAAALSVDSGASQIITTPTEQSTESTNSMLTDAAIEDNLEAQPTAQNEYTDPTAQDIQHGMSEIAKGAKEGALENTIQRLEKDGEVQLFKEDSIAKALEDQNYNVRLNDDGSASIIGVKNPATNQWHGQGKTDLNQPETSITEAQPKQIEVSQQLATLQQRFDEAKTVPEKARIRKEINALQQNHETPQGVNSSDIQSTNGAENSTSQLPNSARVDSTTTESSPEFNAENVQPTSKNASNLPTKINSDTVSVDDSRKIQNINNLNTTEITASASENNISMPKNTILDAQNNIDKTQTNNVADQLAQLEQQFLDAKSVPQKAKLKKQIDQLNSQQTEMTTTPFGSEQIQKQYGDKAESVMSDIEILGDDFTIDLRDDNKKTNALNNPNYNAVQKADGSVEIVGMKHPSTGEWVGKKPNAISIDENAHQAATSSQNNTPEPTQAQIEAGNYKKGHIKVHGLDISIENPKGSERRGTDPNGKEWAHTMSDHYGYIKRTKGADNEHIDTYIGNNPDSNQVFIVDQIDQESGNFDEHKVMLGFDSQEEATTAYKSNFDKGWKVGPIRNMDMEQFKDWLKNEDTSKPATNTDANKPKEAIKDLGEKIGGARKDTALSTGKSKKTKSTDDRPTWAKRYTVSEIVTSTNSNEIGKWVIEDSKKTDWKGIPKKLGTFDSEQEAQDMLPVVAVGLKHRIYARREGKSGFEIWRQISDVKRVKVVNQVFDTKQDAQTYLIKNATNILETSTTFGELDLPRPENTVRRGIERRKGDAKDIDFMKVFGFRGVEFGNWNNQEERQQLLNDAYDGLLDLAEVLKIPAKAISLNGDLALAFGARGQGLSSARAHYEPAKVVINLTKMNGAGSLAHEWWHAFDHYLARQDGIASAEWVVDADGTRSLKISNSSKDRMVSHGFSYRNSGVREDVRDAYTDLMKTMSTKAEQYVEDVQAVDKFVGQSRDRVKERLDSLREDLSRQRDPKYYKRHNKPASAEQLVVFDTISQKLINGELLETEWRTDVKNKSASGIFSGARWTNDALEQLGEIYKSVRGRSGFSKDQDAVLDRLRSAMNSYANRLKMLADAQKEVSKTRKIPTKFVMDAKNLDEGRGSDYWTTPHELSARAFQGFVEDKITENNGRSPFLNHAPENAAIETPWGWMRPYPHGDERKAINAKFSDLVDTLKTEETETGIKLYSRDKLKPDNERRGASPLDTTFTPLSVVSATRRVLSILEHLKIVTTQIDASVWGRIVVGWQRVGVNKVKGLDSHSFTVQVVESFDGLPSAIQEDNRYQGENGETKRYDVLGVWHNGTLYINAGDIQGNNSTQQTTFEMYEELILHEVVGHFGVQQIFGREYKTKLQQLFNALGGLEGIRKIAKDNGVDMQQFNDVYINPRMQAVKDEIYTESDVQQSLVGELFAFVAQNAKSRPFVRQKLKEVIGYIRQWLRDRGFDKFLSRYNDADLMMFLSEARKAVVDRSFFGKYKNQEFSSKNDSDTPLYSRRTKSNTGSTVQQVRGVLIDRFGKDTIKELERQGKLEIIQDYSVEGVEGFYYNGKAVLVASNLTAESTVPTFLHELGGHAGFQNMMNQKQYNELMNQFNKLVEQGNPVALAAKMLAEREQGSERQQLEYLPYLLTLSSTMQQRNVIQRNALQKLINNIASYVKAWVFDNFGINLNLNPDDMLALSERMIGQIKHQSSLDLIRQKYHGTNQWMTAPNGAKTHLSEQQWLQVRTPEFKKWFGDWENDAANASQVLDENGEPKVVYHGTATEFNEFKQGHGLLGDGIYLTDSFDTADIYANIRGENGFVLPLFVNIRNAFKTTGNVSRDKVVEATKSGKYQGVVHQFENQEYIVALEPNQVKMAEGNTGTFNSESSDIRFSRSSNYDDITNRIANGFRNLPKTGDWINKKGVDWLKIGLGFLSRRHLTEVYGKLLPQLNKYNELAAQMDADKNDIAANADNIVREWSKLKDEEALANVMHDATLAQIDPAKPYQQGDNKVKYQQLIHAYNNLSPEAQAMYKKARNAYSGHYAKVREAIRERILRSALSSQKKADLLKNIEGSFGQIKGVYFPLARFGKYVVVLRNPNGEAEVVSRAETKNEAESVRAELIKKYPQYKADDVKKDAEFNASRDSVGRGFMSDLFDEVGNLGLDKNAQADFEDTLSQLYLSSMPDLSWAKHGIHRKGTAGFSQDARRAFAQHMFSGANYLGKLRYGDQLAQQIDDMKKYSNEQFNKGIGYDQNSASDVIDEMEKRHELLMNPKGNPLSSFLTSVGFMYYMGLSPAAAMVNLSQTALIAYPIMGAKWGFDKAGKELLKASQDFGIGLKSGYKTPDFSSLEGFKNSVGDIYNPDIASILKGDELVAYEEAVKRGVIDVTQAHDLAGIAQGEDSKVMWYFRPAMRLASGMFHHAERFNREVTFIAAYRLARQHVNTNGSKATHSEAFEQAIDAVYKGHFDYSTGNRARFMQGNIAKVLLLFKQYAQNMIYTLVRNAHQSLYALEPSERTEARRALAGILGMHALAAGALGLPFTGMLATASILIAKKSKLGAAAFAAAATAAFFGAGDGDDEDPYELENVIRNWLADIHPFFADLVFGGVPRALSPVDLSGRVGLNNLIIPDVQEGLEGADWATAMQSALLGPVVGISTSTVKGLQQIQEGDYGRGIETMLPIFLKNAMKSYRYADEGVLTKNKDVIHDKDVTGVELFSQAIGFSPASVRTSYEGRSAIFQYRTKLEDHRRELMRKWVVARQEDDSDGMNKVWTEILEFNAKTAEKNPKMRISRMNLMQSYKATERKAKETGDGGVYLTKRQKGAEEQGGFAFNR
ncbi:PLxRFG domain-containing protein [Acinetobacter ursingii]|uniref:PLxRFG domain-containing protein n=1 Tax=Acinetobacter ursingii TaxID=108980 RepID=UPI00300BF8D8